MDTPCKWHPPRFSTPRKGRPQAGGRPVYIGAWEAQHGPLQPGLVLHHLCHQPQCVNVDHLQPMTQSEHARVHAIGGDQRAGQALKTHCAQGHPYDEANTRRYTFLRNGRPINARACRECNRDKARRHYHRNKGA